MVLQHGTDYAQDLTMRSIQGVTAYVLKHARESDVRPDIYTATVDHAVRICEGLETRSVLQDTLRCVCVCRFK